MDTSTLREPYRPPRARLLSSGSSSGRSRPNWTPLQWNATSVTLVDRLDPYSVEQVATDWREMPGDGPSPHLGWEELACRGTGRVYVDPRVPEAFERMREVIGRPLIVTSGYRSPEHNAAVGGATKSQHMLGTAIDVLTANVDPHKLQAAAEDAGFTGVGTYPDQGFLHLDVGPHRTWGKPFPERPATPFERERDLGEDNRSVIRDAGNAGAVVVGAGGAVVADEGLSLRDLMTIETLLSWGAPMLLTAGGLWLLIRYHKRIWVRVQRLWRRWRNG